MKKELKYILEPMPGTELPKGHHPGNKAITPDVLCLVDGKYSEGCYSYVTKKWLIIGADKAIYEPEDVLWFRKIKRENYGVSKETLNELLYRAFWANRHDDNDWRLSNTYMKDSFEEWKKLENIKV